MDNTTATGTSDRSHPLKKLPPDQITDFDYLADAMLPADPHARFRELHQLPHDVLWSTANGGHWIATRRRTIRKILQDPERFSSAHINIPPMEYRAIRLVPEELDPPEHGKFRTLLNPIFSPSAVGDLEANARIVSRELIDAIHPLGKADLMKTVSVPMPCSIFMALVGLPKERLSEFLLYKDQFLFAKDAEEKQKGITSISRTIEELIRDRRSNPKNDTMSRLVQSEVDGRPLNDEELLSMGFLLFLAGLDTVTSAMTSCFAYLAHNSKQREQLIEDPNQIKYAIEEILRRYSVVNLVRTATEDFEFEGVQVTKGEQFLVSTLLANLDDEAISDPMEIDFQREGDPHLGFGLGPHRCAGSHLARIELKVLLQEALPRLTNLRVQKDAKLHWHSANLVGLAELPLEWDVGPQTGLSEATKRGA